jgi:hypothetical protein
MTANDKLYVEVLDDEIIITLPGTSYAVMYYRATAFPQRLLTSARARLDCVTQIRGSPGVRASTSPATAAAATRTDITGSPAGSTT